MRCLFAVAALVSLLPAALCVPSPLELIPIRRVTGPKKANSYIVTLKKGGTTAAIAEGVKGPKTVWEKLNAFQAQLSNDELNALRARRDVESIEEDGVATIHTKTVQHNAPWGLQRISQDQRVTGDPTQKNFIYTYDDAIAKVNVDVYVIDTGINVNHYEFEGRAYWGATFGGYEDADGNGHGTHCAGTIGGKTVGVAKQVSLIAVKVLDDSGSGYYSDVISGMAWTMAQALSSGLPSIASMSLGGPPSPGVDRAVAGLTAAGVHVIVAAGNSAEDAGYTSPAGAPSAITVAASDINDQLAWFSNYGKLVDIVAPGVDVISAYAGSNYAYAILSGTSMATPHVAGLAAYFISQHGDYSQDDLMRYLGDLSVRGALKYLRGETVNLLANNEY